MTGPLDVLTRGVDSSGRPLHATRQQWQHFDRVNAECGGILVIVQGAFRARDGGGASASAGTHDQAGCIDIRTWNLSADLRTRMLRAARDPAIVGGAAAWYRTPAQGFDEHSHWLLGGDSPMHPDAAQQWRDYLAGRNGLASGAPDDFWRPDPIHPYTYTYLSGSEEDPMADYAAQLDRIAADAQQTREGIATLRDLTQRVAEADRQRDAAEAARFGEFRRTLAKRDAAMVDQLGRILASLPADVPSLDQTRKLVREQRRIVLRQLRDNPDTEPQDDPSDDALAAAEGD